MVVVPSPLMLAGLAELVNMIQGLKAIWPLPSGGVLLVAG